MNRFTSLLLIFATFVFAAVGCKRSNLKPRDPVGVIKDGDFIPPPNIQDASANFLKKVPKQNPPDETEADRKIREKNELQDQQAKEKAALEALTEELRAVGKSYRKFYAENAPPAYTVENFRKHLRREGLKKEGKSVEVKKIVVAIDADINAKDHILAYRADATGGTQETVLASLAVVPMAVEDIKAGIEKQELQVLWQKYDGFARQNAGQPPTQESLLNYLQKNASPAITQAVESKIILVNLAAQPANPGHMLACRAVAEEGYKGSEKYLKGHLAVMGNGVVQYVQPDFVKTVFK